MTKKYLAVMLALLSLGLGACAEAEDDDGTVVDTVTEDTLTNDTLTNDTLTDDTLTDDTMTGDTLTDETTAPTVG